MTIHPYGHPQYNPQCMEICHCPVCDDDYLGIDINDTCPICNYPERQPASAEKATVRLVIRITPSQKAYLEAQARLLDKENISDLIRWQLTETMPNFPAIELKRGNPQPQQGIPKKKK